MKPLLVVDNYDSFVFNLVRYLRRLGQEVLVFRNTAIGVEQVRRLAPAAIVLSPGPCSPKQAGCSLDLVRAFCGNLPTLGVCLGHQTIAEALGGRVVRAPEPVHGRTSLVYHDGRGVFEGLPSPLRACRYHSLIVERQSLPACLEVCATTEDGIVMAFRHRQFPVVGLQFHPESILTEMGYAVLAGFLRLAGLNLPSAIPSWESEFAPGARGREIEITGEMSGGG